MDIKKIIQEELQQHYGEVRYLWVTSDESLYVSWTNGMLTPTNELTYDSILEDGESTAEKAYEVHGDLSNNRIHYIVDEVSWGTSPITQEMISDLKLVKWVTGAIRDDDEDVFTQLGESIESDDLSWMDDITPKVDSCDDLVIGGDYTISGDYCFNFHNTPFTLVDIEDVIVNKHTGTIVPHLLIDLYKHMRGDGYYETHSGDGQCKKDTCFWVSCDSISNTDSPTHVTIGV